MDVRSVYYGNEKEHMRKEENCNITPFVHLSSRLDIPDFLSCHPQGY